LAQPAQEQRLWVGLTDEEIDEGNKQSWVTKQAWESAVWWASEKLKEKKKIEKERGTDCDRAAGGISPHPAGPATGQPGAHTDTRTAKEQRRRL
jgi:hypothetical protein